MLPILAKCSQAKGSQPFDVEGLPPGLCSLDNSPGAIGFDECWISGLILHDRAGEPTSMDEVDAEHLENIYHVCVSAGVEQGINIVATKDLWDMVALINNGSRFK